jgi:hypothetical protein
MPATHNTSLLEDRVGCGQMPDVVAVHFKDLDRGVQGGVMLVPVAPSSADGREGARCMKHDIAGG